MRMIAAGLILVALAVISVPDRALADEAAVVAAQVGAIPEPTASSEVYKPPPRGAPANRVGAATRDLSAQRRVALVIGNGAYQHLPRLENPVNDAQLIASTLQSVGFQLIEGRAQTDLDRAGLERAIRQFGRELTSGSVGLFYYAGHGLQFQGANFLVPVTANPVTAADLDFELIDANTALKQMEVGGSELNVVILDACRNNPFGSRGVRDAGQGLAVMRAPRGTLISYATQPGNIAIDGTTEHSPYTAALAEAIGRPGLPILDVFNEVGLAVDRATGGRQQPWIASSPLEGAFYFIAPTNVNISVPPATEATTSASSAVAPIITPRLSIVVLPFTNLGNDPEQQYFVDGITEDLTTDLSRVAHMFVISRNTAFTYRDKSIDAKQIGRELGVRYALEGSARRSGSQVRVNVQLVDALTDAHLWAERFDRHVGDLFALQNDITRQIAVALSAELISAEAARPTEHPDALDYIFRGRAAFNRGATPENFSKAVEFFEHALVLDPQSVEAQELLALTLASRVVAGMTSSRHDDITRAKQLIAQVLTTSPSSTQAHFASSQLLRAQGRCKEAIPELETVIASNRNSPGALYALGYCKIFTGSLEEAIPLEEQAIRLGPRDPFVFSRYLVLGEVHLLQSRLDEAIIWLEKARSSNPAAPWPRIWLASAYGLKGDLRRAGAELAEARRLKGGKDFSSILYMRAGNWGVPDTRALHEATFFAGLRKAGMPEE